MRYFKILLGTFLSVCLTGCYTHIPETNYTKLKQPVIAYNHNLGNNIHTINRYVNETIRYKPDKEDYWQSANETMLLKMGDCEDIAILKKQMLLKHEIQSKLLIVLDKKKNDIHMVLLVNNLVLDNQYTEPLVFNSNEYQSRYKSITFIRG